MEMAAPQVLVVSAQAPIADRTSHRSPNYKPSVCRNHFQSYATTHLKIGPKKKAISASLVSAISIQAHNNDQTSRPFANFQPSIWGDHFLSYTKTDHLSTEDKKTEKKIQELKEVVRKMLVSEQVKKPSYMFDLIDTIQRLGISYHFEMEIEQALQLLLPIFDLENDNDIYKISLGFRLLRQQGHKISCHIFEKFKSKNGGFKKSLINDVRGLLSLYEASHLMVQGEDILEEALAFTTTYLKASLPKLGFDTPLSTMVRHALIHPIHKNIPRLEARHYLSIYEKDPIHNEHLLTIAKLDFNMLQKLHQRELADITSWWKDCDFVTKLPFARDRLVECYFWVLGVYFEYEYSFARKILTKVGAMLVIIDDIYDSFGTYEELTLFTDAIERWEKFRDIHKLPDYMKVCFHALLDVYAEMEDELLKIQKSYRLYYAKEEMKNQVRAYFDESKWLHHQYTPSIDEYKSVALASFGHSLLSTTSFIRMGDIVTEETFKWAFSNPKIIRASCIIGRLMDDIAEYKFEQKQKYHIPSAVECYMKQYGVTKEEACIELNKQIKEAWEDINQELLRPTSVPMPILTRVLNLARVADVVYKKDDGFTNSSIENFISSLLIHPLS